MIKCRSFDCHFLKGGIYTFYEHIMNLKQNILLVKSYGSDYIKNLEDIEIKSDENVGFLHCGQSHSQCVTFVFSTPISL